MTASSVDIIGRRDSEAEKNDQPDVDVVAGFAQADVSGPEAELADEVVREGHHWLPAGRIGELSMVVVDEVQTEAEHRHNPGMNFVETSEGGGCPETQLA